MAEMRIIWQYSERKKSTNVTEEYSTLYPETSSLSASGKSNGILLVSAKELIKNIIKVGKNGITNRIFSCSSTIIVKLKELEQRIIVIKISPTQTS